MPSGHNQANSHLPDHCIPFDFPAAAAGHVTTSIKSLTLRRVLLSNVIILRYIVNHIKLGALYKIHSVRVVTSFIPAHLVSHTDAMRIGSRIVICRYATTLPVSRLRIVPDVELAP